jgi:hypothetical protein
MGLAQKELVWRDLLAQGAAPPVGGLSNTPGVAGPSPTYCGAGSGTRISMTLGHVFVIIILVFALVRRHVTGAAMRAVVVAGRTPHIQPLIPAACAAVEVSKEHGGPLPARAICSRYGERDWTSERS